MTQPYIPFRKIQRCEKGYSLMELMIVIAILAIGLMAIFSLQLSSIQGNFVSKTRSGGVSYATEKMEWLMCQPWDGADLSNGNHGPETSGIYSLNYKIDDADLAEDTKTISISVTWKEKKTEKEILIYNTIPWVI